MYRKLAVAVAGSVLAYLLIATESGSRLNVYDYIQICSVAVGSVLVWLTAEGPKGTVWSQAKAIAYGITAVLATLLVTLQGGLSTHEIIELVVAFVTGAGIIVVGGAPVHPAVPIGKPSI